ncbi:hypothetical protein, partial [Enterobacter asburiae]|uniref:hypothetical protein n=1 Tax=Enterobacter asburiae TaxID=61645 RepID=UPI002965DFF4
VGYAAQRPDRITGVPARVIQSVNSDLFNKAAARLLSSKTPPPHHHDRASHLLSEFAVDNFDFVT